MKKNIFEIAKENENLERDIKRIIRLLKEEKIIFEGGSIIDEEYTLYEFVEAFCFNNWENRGHCIDLQDFLTSINYQFIESGAPYYEGDMLLFIELVYNFWKLALNKINESTYEYYSNFFLLQNIMEDILEKLNYKAHYDEAKEQLLVIEDKPEVTAVADIVTAPIALDVIIYNHHTLKGNIQLKKKILLALGADLEPKRKQLKTINAILEDNIFRILNEFNLRHNNIDPQDNKYYYADVATLSSKQLEEWYDELYQMILLAYLVLDNIERSNKVKKFYDKRNNNK